MSAPELFKIDDADLDLSDEVIAWSTRPEGKNLRMSVTLKLEWREPFLELLSRPRNEAQMTILAGESMFIQDTNRGTFTHASMETGQFTADLPVILISFPGA